MEYTFISKEMFEILINNYLNKIQECKCDKALINLELLNKIKTVLLEPKNMNICNKNTRNWAKKRFYLEEIVPGDYRVMVKVDNKPVLVIKNMYEVLCRTHAEIDQHARQNWHEFSSNSLIFSGAFTKFSAGSHVASYEG